MGTVKNYRLTANCPPIKLIPSNTGMRDMNYGFRIEWDRDDLSPSIEHDVDDALFVAGVPTPEWENARAFLLAGIEIFFTRGYTRSIRRVIVKEA